jgi:hypothetical protein
MMQYFIAAALASALAASPASAAFYNKTAAANGRLAANYYLAINPDCSLVEYPTVRLVSPPANGRVVISKGRGFPYFPPVNPRSACNRKRVPAMMVEYRPGPGYVGSDSFAIDVIFPMGAERNDTYNIQVK